MKDEREKWARVRIIMIGAFNDYVEDSAIWTADTSVDYPKTRLPIERWQGQRDTYLIGEVLSFATMARVAAVQSCPEL